jgi:hypothetical protein
MNNFHSQFLNNPAWTIPVSVAIWLVVTFVTSRTSGWAVLAQQFAADEAIEGDRYRFVSGTMGKGFFRFRYANTLFITVGRKGLHISTILPLRIAHTPLLIPWRQIESMSSKQKLHVFEYVEILIRNRSPVLQLRGTASKKILEGYTKYSREEIEHDSNRRNK